MEMEDYGAVLADALGGGKPSNAPRVKYGTVTKVSGSTLDVSLAGGTITGVCMTVSCAGAKVGDRVVLLIDGALVTCLGIIATADNARYAVSGEGVSWGKIAEVSGNGKGGYFHLARVTVKTAYANDLPVLLTVANRAQGVGRISLQFSNSSSTDPDVNVFHTGGVGASFKCYASKAKASTWDVYMKANENWGIACLYDLGPSYASIDVEPVMKRVDSLPSGVIESVSEILSAYPVGSIYMSVNSTNPNNLFGGTWQQLSNRFLVGVGSSYSNGATGGASSYTPKGSVGSHTLTTSEIPSHTHSIHCAYTSGSSRRDADVIVYDGWDMNGYKWTTEWSGSVGGGGSHNHGFTGTAQTILPPYLAVYMWKRTS